MGAPKRASAFEIRVEDNGGNVVFGDVVPSCDFDVSADNDQVELDNFKESSMILKTHRNP